MPLELTTVALVRNYLGDQDADSTQITAYATAAEAAIARMCGRFDAAGNHWLTASRVERIDGEWSPDVLLKFTPITALTYVRVTTNATAYSAVDTTLLDVDGIAIADLSASVAGYTGRLGHRNGGLSGVRSWFDTGLSEPGPLSCIPNFGGGSNRVVVSYTGGYATVAAIPELSLAATMLASQFYYGSLYDPTVKTENLGEYSYTNETNPFTNKQSASTFEALVGPHLKVTV